MRGMKILYAGIRRENYDPRRRDSFEYINFFLTLKAMAGVEVVEYPFDRILEVGKKKWNEELYEIARREKPDLLFAFMYTDELDIRTLQQIKQLTTSVAWFADDYWRFWNYSRRWPPYFSYVITTYSRAVDWYKKSGFDNAILSQWACNTNLYKPIVLSPELVEGPYKKRYPSTSSGNNVFEGSVKDIDVSFVGQKKSGRVKMINFLRRAGINIQCFGYGWPNGKISHDDMLKIFSRSKICLNLTDRKSIFDPSVIARLFLKKSVNRIVPDFHFLDNLKAVLHFPILHTHARPFELAGCGAFTISGRSEDIGKYYEEGKEMVFYDSPNDLVNKIKYYLAHDAERVAIARAGYERTIKEHTYEQRFREIFRHIGF
ncbi:MAG: glycosyltransferase [Patescibacteria group bacterium]